MPIPGNNLRDNGFMDPRHKHSPTPWRQVFGEPDSSLHLGINDANDKIVVCHCCLKSHNGAFIVKAVNAHEALIKALKQCVKWLPGDQDFDEDMALARAALKLAGEVR